MAPFLWIFNYNPVGPAVMVALFGIATVWLIYKIGKEFFGTPVGLIASALYAISPLVVTYSRSSWNPNPMPFFSLLTLYATYKALAKNSAKLFVISGFLFGIAMQLHYLALFLGAIILAYILLYWFVFSKKNFLKLIKQYAYVLIGFVIGWSPFLAFEVRHGFMNTTSIFKFIFHSKDINGGGAFFDIVGGVFFRVFGRLTLNFPSYEKFPMWSSLGIGFWNYATYLLGTACLAFLIYKCFKEYKKRSLDFAKFSLLSLWLILGVCLFGFYKKSIYDYYFGFIFPLPFLIVGVFIKSLWQKRIGKILSVLLLILLVWLNNLTPPYKDSANGQLSQTEEISKFVVSKTKQEPFNFALITAGNSDHAYRYFFTVWGREPVTIQNPTIDPQRKTVMSQLLVVCETSAPCEPLGNSLWEIAGFGRAEIAEEWSFSVVKVFRLTHYKGK
jgi:4-amino-4-deoxy-L-arabinose transferase-like glycosyltransferase